MNTILSESRIAKAPNPSEKGENLSHAYDSLADVYASKNADQHPDLAKFAYLFTDLLPQGGKILDVGCGAGRDLAVFQASGFRGIGIDASEKMLAIAKVTATDCKFVKMDFREIKFPRDSFDGVWSAAALHHLKKSEILPVIGRMKKILKSGGVFFGSLKKGEGESTEPDSYLGQQKLFVARYRKKEVIRILKAWQFEIQLLEESDTWISFLALKP